MNQIDTSLRVKIRSNIQDISRVDYTELCRKANAPIFYNWAFLKAAQEASLLPAEQCLYFVAYRKKEMVGFVQSYAMRNADPFGVIAENAGITLNEQSLAWLSHIMHFYESTIICDQSDSVVKAVLLNALHQNAKDKQGHCVGLVNVVDENLITQAKKLGWQVNYMWDRYYIHFSQMENIDHFFTHLERSGRNEMRRQLRKFYDSDAQCRIIRAPFEGIEEVAQLCYQTTKKNGTPQYYPPEKFCNFVKCLGDHALIFVIQLQGEILGALVCFEEQHTLHLWAGGMTYEKSHFSPYTVLFYHTYEYALQKGMATVEAGRTNKKIKQRLGFSPKPLYSILKPL